MYLMILQLILDGQISQSFHCEISYALLYKIRNYVIILTYQLIL